MAASFPGTLRAFATHINITEIVDASHINDLQAEVNALETYVGTNPHVSTAGGGSSLGAWSGLARTYASLSDRLANVEAGHTADTHTQYIRFAGTETITGVKTFTGATTGFGDGTTAGSGHSLNISTGPSGGGQAAVNWREGTTTQWSMQFTQGVGTLRLRDNANSRDHVTFTRGATTAASSTSFNGGVSVAGNATVAGTLGVTGATTLGATTLGATTLTGALTLAAGTGVVPSTSAVGDAAAGGTSTSVARADHVHGREAFGAVARIQATTAGGTAAAGTDLTPARSDHVHALAASTAPTSSAVGDAAQVGASAQVARADHTHGREAFGAAVQNTIGAASNGAATTVSRSDHFHGQTTAAPAASAVGDAQGAGVATSVSRSDHVHAREAFATGTTASDAGAAAAGTASTVPRGDHKHSVSVGSPTALTSFGLVASDGTATTLARSDHSHGTPPAPTAASVGAVAKSGDTMTGALAVPSPLTIGDGTIAKTTGGAWALSSGNLGITGSFTASTTVTGTAGVYDGVNRVYSSANPPPSAAPIVIMPFFVGGSIGTGLRSPEFICPVPMTLRGAWSRSRVGSGTYQIYVNGAAASGGAAAYGTTATLNDFTDVLLNTGDRVQLNVNTASADAVDLSVTVDVVTR